MNPIGKLLPVDGYFVELRNPLPTNYLQSLTHLYQPLIGSEALMLYQTLLNDILLQEESPQTHHTLMNYLILPLDQIYEARIKLEGMGLLKTYKKESQEIDIYTYVLEPPFDPKSFFKEAMFTTLLYNHIGEQKFRKLQNFYMAKETNHRGDNITVAFQEVFQTFKPNKDTLAESFEPEVKEEPAQKQEFKWLEQMLKQRKIPVRRVLTETNKKLISQMIQLYDLESYEIDDALLWALSEENDLDTEEFKQACHDLFKAKNNNKALRLTNKTPKPANTQINTPPKSKEEALIQKLESISPKELLEDLSSGGMASAQDMKLIEEIMLTQGLPAPVMNVLIHYCLLQTNMKLTKNFVGTIAGQWSRAKLKTAKEAMEFAKKEKENYEKAKTNKRPYQQKSASKDIVPDWFKEGKHLQGKPQETKQDVSIEEQQRLAHLMKQYSEGN
ncbi:replication initiation and membrane attachment family protein [Oceanobacillus sp. CAU 1775]